MSLLFDADTDQLTTPSVATSADQTLAVWALASTDTARVQLWQHAGSDLQIAWRGDLAGDRFEAFRGGATYGEAVADAANWTHYGTGKYLCFVARFSSSTSTLWIGDESNTPAGPSSYTTQIAYVSPVLTAGLTYIGCGTTSTRWWRNRVGGYAWWNGTVLTDTEVGNWWARPFDTSGYPTRTMFGRCGSNGTTDVPDNTGNGNTGTITGLSSPDFQPRRLYPGRRRRLLAA